MGTAREGEGEREGKRGRGREGEEEREREGERRRGRKGEKEKWVFLFFRPPILLKYCPNFMTSFNLNYILRLYLQIPSHKGLGLQCIHLEETQCRPQHMVFLCKGGMVPLSPGRKKKKKNQLVLPSYDVIIGLYFTAESQNVSIDNTTPEFGDRGIWGRGGGGVRQES